MAAVLPIFVAARPDRLIVTEVDALTAVFDRASGQTHVLAEPLPQILAVMSGADGLSAQEIVTRLSEQFDIFDGDAIDARIAECLYELAALGLVEQR